MREKKNELIHIAEESGKILLSYWKRNISVEFKRDELDPVTRADKESDTYIRNQMIALYPSDTIVTEEAIETHAAYQKRVWYIDPLDGTKYFLRGSDGFGVCIGLVVDGQPVFGIVHIPARGITYFAERGSGAFKRMNGKDSLLIPSRVSELDGSRVFARNVIDPRPFDDVIARLPVTLLIDDSFALCMCRVADGEAEAAVPNSNRGSKWDTAAAQVILEEVGGVVTDMAGGFLDYDKPGVGWDRWLGVAANNKEIHREIIEFLEAR